MAKRTVKRTTTHAQRHGGTRAKDLTVSSAKPRAVANRVSREHVAVRAYHIFLSRGATPGRELDDWLQAEQELLHEGFRLAS